MNTLHKRLYALLLTAVLLFTGIVPAAAQGEHVSSDSAESVSAVSASQNSSEPAETEIPDQPETITESSVSDSAPEALFLYSEISEDETTQGIIIKLDTQQTLESAELVYSDNGETLSAQAEQVISNYAAFFLPVCDNRTFLSLNSVAGGTTQTTDLSPLEEGDTLDYGELAAASQVSAYSADTSQEDAAANVITASLDDEITAEDIAASVTSTAASFSASSRLGSQNKIVVLDPGHGNAGSGTYRDWGDFVIDEAVINFKISQYTKEALEKNYSNVTVYMTKTKQSENPSISQRVNFAVEKNADILVSQHINATSEQITTAHGVLAMVPKLDSSHQYHADTAKEAQELARSILDELVALGFNDMGFQTLLSQTGDTYEDGSLADYYGIVRYCRKANLPGTIIEHGFANNREDALKLNNDSMLKKIGEADAMGIAAYLGLKELSSPSVSPTPTPSVTPTPSPSPTPTPSPVPSTFTGWKLTGGNWYYYHKGEKTTGWQNVNGTWYFMNSSGVMLTGWQNDNGSRYYLNSSGAMVTGWQKVSGTWYYFSSSGAMLTGWQKVGGIWYYMNSSGAMLTGWQKVDGIWYYLSSSGAMLTGWQKVGGTWYYMNSSGAMLTGWQLINGTWYYLSSSGAMLTGWQKVSGTWYYMNSSGAMLTGWQKVGGTWYYLSSSGAMLTGWQKVSGTWYYMNSSGAMLTGWQKVGGTWYYLSSSGAMLTGWQLIGGSWYYMNSSGAMLTGWQLIDGKWYYLESSGRMASNTWIGSYYVNSSGVWVENSSSVSGTGEYMIAIDAGHQKKGDSSLEPLGPGSTTMKAKVASGTYGRWSGLNEYQLNLLVAQKLKSELTARGYQVYMIRESHDVNISNAQRAKNAANAGADLLVRIHANGDSNASVHGALTMAPSGSNPFLSSSLISESQQLSTCIINSLCNTTGAQNRGMMTTDTMSGINWSAIPVTIVEMGFMTNQAEDLKMATDSYQQKIAKGIADGIDQYYS